MSEADRELDSAVPDFWITPEEAGRMQEAANIVTIMVFDHYQERTRRSLASLIADPSHEIIVDIHAGLMELGFPPMNYCCCSACFTNRHAVST